MIEFLNATAGAEMPWYSAILASPFTMIILAFAIMYFFMIRPQRKRQKEIDNFRNSLQVGQDVYSCRHYSNCNSDCIVRVNQHI